MFTKHRFLEVALYAVIVLFLVLEAVGDSNLKNHFLEVLLYVVLFALLAFEFFWIVAVFRESEQRRRDQIIPPWGKRGKR